jgi:ribosomal-protein-alanine N-acetyltransferase
VTAPPPLARPATAADLDRLLVLEKVCFPEDPWTRGMLTDELTRPGGIFVVLEEPGRPVVGFAIGWAILDELHVLQVAVDPRERRRGLGRRLMEHLHAEAARSEVAWLEVRADNPAAIGLYEAFAYERIALRRRYYEDGCDAVVMRRPLAGPPAP